MFEACLITYKYNCGKVICGIEIVLLADQNEMLFGRNCDCIYREMMNSCEFCGSIATNIEDLLIVSANTG